MRAQFSKKSMDLLTLKNTNYDYMALLFHVVKTFSTAIRDRLCSLVVRVSGYRYRGPGLNSRRYQIF
jgi:hypothetical protein